MLGLLKAFRTHLDLRFQSGALHVRVVERPGIFLTSDELTKLKLDLQTVVRSLGKGDLDYGVVGGDPERLKHSIITLISDAKTGQPLAFNALAIMKCELKGRPTDVIHLGLVVVDPTVRAQGLSWLLYGFTTFLVFVRRKLKPLWVSNVTQVPAVVGMVSESFSNMYPTPNPEARRSYSHLTLARQIMTDHRPVFGVGADATFNEDKFIIENSYTGGSDNLKKTFEETTHHRVATYNDWSLASLDYKRGDDFLQLGQATLGSFLDFVTKGIPKESLISVLGNLALQLCEGIFVPALRWFFTHEPYGDLRALPK